MGESSTLPMRTVREHRRRLEAEPSRDAMPRPPRRCMIFTSTKEKVR